MPEFLSKLQHNNYEKGEFSDEKVRSLEDTIALIQNFPWDAERTLTDIQLTGPSVTIEDEAKNYLKLGLYFGGKFCIYYLDNDNHLYEFHAQNIDEANELVKQFFSATLDLEKFDKHIFNIGNKPHFFSSTFQYRLPSWRSVLLSIFLVCYMMLIIGAAVSSRNGNESLDPILFLIFIYGVLVIYLVMQAVINRNLYLQISRGNNNFLFGKKGNIITYNKLDIAKIIEDQSNLIYSKSLNFNTEYQIVFKNGESLKIPKMLITRQDFHSKFPSQLKIPFVYKRRMMFNTSEFTTYQ